MFLYKQELVCSCLTVFAGAVSRLLLLEDKALQAGASEVPGLPSWRLQPLCQTQGEGCRQHVLSGPLRDGEYFNSFSPLNKEDLGTTSGPHVLLGN